MSILNSRFLAATLVCGTVLTAIGCQSTGEKQSKFNPLASFQEAEPTPQTPDRVVATWSEAVLHQNGAGSRGFGGRLYFYDRVSDEPVMVEGQLVVYAFAEDDRAETDNRPTRRYVFPPEQFAKHQSDSEIGVSYSIWLPWDELGGEQAEVSLIARFEPLKGGGLVVSDQARQFLPGRAKTPTLVAQSTKPANIEQAGYTTKVEVRDATTAEQNKLQMKATTISLPGKFRRSPVVTTQEGDVTTRVEVGNAPSTATLPSIKK
ncbi:hypothetical protein [Aeoliella mucimassa]|uniref:Uncharacterized protein n=1 Tax=Aeoliella mucimassa TaxID=2527972 RepID=A0A518AL29_9BACT|nr:hypothetical protein [Aeoliella mucimassa]QDU55439.1 hypothetical protein Pan181_16280 [Aeoliella mucimassa]